MCNMKRLDISIDGKNTVHDTAQFKITWLLDYMFIVFMALTYLDIYDI